MCETAHYINRGCISPFCDIVFAGGNIAVNSWVFKDAASSELNWRQKVSFENHFSQILR